MRYALERRGMKVSRSKTEYMCVNERGDGELRFLRLRSLGIWDQL